MTESEAKRIGQKQGLLSVVWGLVIAQCIFSFLFHSYGGFVHSFFWFVSFDYKLNILIGISIMFSCGYVFGGFAGKQILLKNRNWVFAGCLCGMAVLLVTAFLCGWTGFLQEGIKNLGSNENPFEDYIFKPFFWITTFGLVPALLVGVWCGSRIKKAGTSDNLAQK